MTKADIVKAASFKAIDVHAHFGEYLGDGFRHVNEFLSGDENTVVERAKKANIRITIVSPLRALLPRGKGAPVIANEEAYETISHTKELLQWVVVDPLKKKTFGQAAEMLTFQKSAGIKIHPEEHCYRITDYGRLIFEFAERYNAVIQSHSGEQKSLPEDFVRFANDFPEVKLIVSHLGCGFDNDRTHQVRAIIKARHGNIYTDTSSAQSITSSLIEWAVREVGADHILFGTDSPLYYSPMQRARIDFAEISNKDKALILYKNAEKLFPCLSRQTVIKK
jgi:predicted TIM-barrel fold metal-dependent hydrolase